MKQTKFNKHNRLEAMLLDVDPIEMTHFDCIDTLEDLKRVICYYGLDPKDFNTKEMLEDWTGATEFLETAGRKFTSENENTFYYVGGMDYPLLEIYHIEHIAG
jgi:hypothetical protein